MKKYLEITSNIKIHRLQEKIYLKQTKIKKIKLDV